MRVSVVVPCHNGESFIEATLRSVLEQSHRAAEIIVVDDGSTDRSREVVSTFGRAVRLIPLEHGGASRARNHGASASAGDALMFLDADDVLGPHALGSLAGALHASPDGIAFCPWRRLELIGGVWTSRPPSCARRVPGDDHLAAWLTGWYHPPCSVLWSRAAYQLSGGWNERLVVNQDGDIVMRALARGVPVTEAEQGVAFYRRSPHGAGGVSSRRLSEAGLRSRLQVLEDLTSELAGSGRLPRYRRHLADAFDRLASDGAERLPALAGECRRRARSLGGSTWLRRSRRAGRAALVATLGA